MINERIGREWDGLINEKMDITDFHLVNSLCKRRIFNKISLP